LPWILGGALITTGAIAAAIEFSGRSPSAPRTAPASSALGASGVAANVTASSPGSTPGPVPASAPSSESAAPGAAPGSFAAGAAGTASSELPAGEVWQCIVNGQRVFSDTRCANDASVRQISDLNVMDMPAPQPATYGKYMPAYGGAPSASTPPYPDDADDTGNVSGDLYPGQALILARERARREHLSRHDSHVRPPPNHGSPGPRNPR